MWLCYLLQLIIAVAGVLGGYNGSFEFKEPGQEYGDTPYVGMRIVSSWGCGKWEGGALFVPPSVQ